MTEWSQIKSKKMENEINQQSGLISGMHTPYFKPWMRVVAFFLVFCMLYQDVIAGLGGDYTSALKNTFQKPTNTSKNTILSSLIKGVNSFAFGENAYAKEPEHEPATSNPAPVYTGSTNQGATYQAGQTTYQQQGGSTSSTWTAKQAGVNYGQAISYDNGANWRFQYNSGTSVVMNQSTRNWETPWVNTSVNGQRVGAALNSAGSALSASGWTTTGALATAVGGAMSKMGNLALQSDGAWNLS
ncbi:MAG: hypothetical protein WCY05_02945, partial [Candidatus Omnitrophota bacterium]